MSYSDRLKTARNSINAKKYHFSCILKWATGTTHESTTAGTNNLFIVLATICLRNECRTSIKP